MAPKPTTNAHSTAGKAKGQPAAPADPSDALCGPAGNGTPSACKANGTASTKGKPTGAPLANMNAVKNGGQLTRLTLGELPQTMRRQTQQARKYRRELEALVMQAKGQVDITDAHLIDEAAQAEVHASVCRWLLRERLDKMTVSDISKCSEQILKAKTARNKAVERLGLNVQPEPIDLQTYLIQAPAAGSNGDLEHPTDEPTEDK